MNAYLIRCMGGKLCNHAPGICTADPEYQATIEPSAPAMCDVFGSPLAIGDRVAFIETHYRSLKKATIVAMTPQKVRLEYPSPYKSRPNESETTLRFPSEVVKG